MNEMEHNKATELISSNPRLWEMFDGEVETRSENVEKEKMGTAL